MACLLFVGYGALAWWFPLWERADQLPLADVRALAPTLPHAFLYALLICALFAAYWIAYCWVHESARPPAQRSLLLMTALFGLPLILTYPINAVDVFRYFYEGRMIVAYGINPLTTPPSFLADDPLHPFAAILLHKTSPYGPLWELLGALIYWLSRGSILWGLMLFKGMGLLAHLAAGILIGAMVASHGPQLRAARLVLWLWNPALLLMFVVDAHNDILMLLCLLLGYWQICQGRPTRGLILLMLAPLVKPIGLLPIPFFAVIAWQQLPGWFQRLRVGLLASAGAVLVTVAAFFPFGWPLPLIQRLANEAQTGPSFSPIEFMLALGDKLRLGLEVPLVARAASLLFGLLALILFWLAWRGRRPLGGAADIFAAYLLTALKFRIWYPTWLFPWLVLDVHSRFRLYTGLSFLLLSQLSVIYYGHIRIAWLGSNFGTAILIGVPLVFVAPFLLGFLLHRFQHRLTRATNLS